jgi:hypothetical protein
MNTPEILAHIDGEIARLEQVKAALTGEPTKRKQGRPSLQPGKAKSAKKRTMSAAGRARIAAAQRARWAKAKKAA